MYYVLYALKFFFKFRNLDFVIYCLVLLSVLTRKF